MTEDYAEGVCPLCTLDLEPGTPTRSVSTPKGRRPAHASCYEKYLNIDAGAAPPVHSDTWTEAAEAARVGYIPTTTEEEAMAGTAVTQWDEKWAADAERWAKSERVGGDFLSVKGGILAFQEEALRGNQMLVVILDVVVERTYYAEAYDSSAERNNPPVCYAFGRMGEEDEIAPHPSMQSDLTYFEPQNDICKTCPNNAWGSADRGRGKACGERRRMALLPAGYFTPKGRSGRDGYEMNVFTDEHHYETADIAYLKLPVMSVKDWARYVNQLAASHRRPPHAAITRVYVEPDEKSQFRVKFETIELLPTELAEVIEERVAEAEKNIIFGYQAPGMEAEEEAPRPRKSARRK